ncbi:hypothetical protein ACPWSH_25860, partial [Pandoraea pneumonica]
FSTHQATSSPDLIPDFIPAFIPLPTQRPTRGRSRARFIRTAGSAAVALALASTAAPVWAACTVTDITGCGAAGGAGFPGRSGAG